MGLKSHLRNKFKRYILLPINKSIVLRYNRKQKRKNTRNRGGNKEQV